MQTDHDEIIRQVRQWLETVIIGLNFCPFARREFERDSIRYPVIAQADMEICLHALIDECRFLDAHPEAETSLLIFPQGFADFDDFLDLLGLADALLEQQGYAGIYQLASFHPDYCFEGVAAEDVSNYTNRAPWPVLHLIREASIERVLEQYPDPENIPYRNIEKAQQLGLAHMKALLTACLDEKK